MTTRHILSITLSLCAAACLAQTLPKAGAAAAPQIGRALDPAARSNMLARTGGMVRSPATGPVILFLNTQKRVPAAELQETVNHIQQFLRLPCVFADKPATEPAVDAAKALADRNTAAVLVICDAVGQPSLLVAPENRWALVNVAALGGKDVPADKLTERVQKELWRGFGYVMGAANSNFEHCLLKPVLTPADLDALQTKSLCPEPFGQIMVQAQKMGMKPMRMSSYRKACEEGWAPAPTNDIQRAIYAEVKKTPAK